MERTSGLKTDYTLGKNKMQQLQVSHIGIKGHKERVMVCGQHRFGFGRGARIISSLG